MAEPDDTPTLDRLPPVRSGRAGHARRVRWPILLVLVWAMLAVADLAIFHVGIGSRPAAAAKPAAHQRASPGSVSPTPGARRRRGASGRIVPARLLAPVSAAAFGPAGYGSGDHPERASLAIDASRATSWTTHWYRTANFGGLQSGTGLLIDMGHAVRITSVQIDLGSARGADLQLLTGSAPARTRLRLAASIGDAGGTLRLRLARPERARYLLIWFTLLPRDSSGTYRASVYNVSIRGRS